MSQYYKETYVSSAPGKVILFGEHAVVYGKLAIAASIDLRTYVYYQPASPPDSNVIVLACPDINFTGSWTVEELMTVAEKFKPSPVHRELMTILSDKLSEEEAVLAISRLNLDASWAEEQVKVLLSDNLVAPQRGAVVVFLTLLLLFFSSSIGKLSGFSVAVSSRLPVGAGLGSSASFSVSLTGCLLNLYTQGALSTTTEPLETTTLLLANRLGYLAEKILHGNPSGVDNTVSAYGGFVSYQGGIFERLDGLSTLNILLTNTKVPRNTKKLVAGVKKLKDQFPAVVDPILDAIHHIALTLKNQLQSGVAGDELLSQIKGLVRLNHSLLHALDVSHPSLEQIVAVTRDHGNLATKLTGAGGGGCTFTLLPPSAVDLRHPAPPSQDPLRNRLHHHGFETYPTTLGGVGLRVAPITSAEIGRALKVSTEHALHFSNL